MRKLKKYFYLGLLALSVSSLPVSADSLAGNFAHKVSDKVDMKIHMFGLDEVKLLDSTFHEAMDHNANWLLELEPNRLLSWFRKEAGLTPRGEVYGGWESRGVAGHCLGHYMSALAMMYAETGNKEYKKRCDYIVSELAECQKAFGSGCFTAIPEGLRCFDELSRGVVYSAGFDLNGLWVPWYTHHKLLAGLIDIYECSGDEAALEVCKKHADWIIAVTSKLDDAKWQLMLNCEHGGMNESFAELYAITGEERYLDSARKFFHRTILEPLSKRQDSITGVHANTQVPKIIGSARIFELTGDKKFETIADYFWHLVTGHYSYANGGNSANERFGKPDVLGDIMHDTTETCNTYNMLKLTRHLFAWNPQASYMDYYERALLNHILAHQHPDRGGALVYKGFLDMPARKNYSHPTDSFWCCVGTGMENHTKYADTIYSYSDSGESLYVNLFISSQLNWQARGISLTQNSLMPQLGKTTLSFNNEKPVKTTLKIRKPYWAQSSAITLNGQPVQTSPGSDGYIAITAKFAKDDTIAVEFGMALHIAPLPDMPGRCAIMYGPTLMAAVLKDTNQVPTIVSDTPEDILSYFVQEKPLEFTLDSRCYSANAAGFTPIVIRLIPLYAVADELYSVYMDVVDVDQWDTRKAEFAEQLRLRAELEARTADFFTLGQMQPERDHELTSEGAGGVGGFNGKNWRDTTGGSFEFDMKVDPTKPMQLICTYWGSDTGKRTFDILINGQKIATQSLNNNKPDHFFDVAYDIPANLSAGKQKVRVKLQAHPDNKAGGLFEARTVTK